LPTLLPFSIFPTPVCSGNTGWDLAQHPGHIRGRIDIFAGTSTFTVGGLVVFGDERCDDLLVFEATLQSPDD